MKTIISFSTLNARHNANSIPATAVPTFGSGFKAFLENSEYGEITSETYQLRQPTDYLGSVDPIDAGHDALQSVTDDVRNRLVNSLYNAILLAMKPTRQAPNLAAAVAALRMA